MYGVCEAWRGVLPSPAPAAYCGQVKRRNQLGVNTATHAQRCVVSGLLVQLFGNGMGKITVFINLQFIDSGKAHTLNHG